jgi:hypothetical protein
MDLAEDSRLDHINFVMSELHDALNSLYESWVDKDREQVKKDSLFISKSVKQISDSLNGL